MGFSHNQEGTEGEGEGECMTTLPHLCLLPSLLILLPPSPPHRSQDESKLSMHIKDSMREHSIADVAGAWYLLVEAYHAKAPALAASVLQTMQRYVPWIDINLVANPK